MASSWYGKAFELMFAAGIDIVTYNAMVMIVDSTYVPDVNTHWILSDVTGEVSSTNYTAGGQVVPFAVVVWDPDAQEAVFSGNDVTWGPVTFVARYAIIYVDDGGSKPLLGYIDFLADQSVFNTDFTIAFDTAGIGAITFTS